MLKNYYLVAGLLLGGIIALFLAIFIISRIYLHRLRLRTRQQDACVFIIDLKFNHSFYFIIGPYITSITASRSHSSTIVSHESVDDTYLYRQPSVSLPFCQREVLCNEFVEKYLLKLHKAYFNPIFDRCYCSTCSPRLLCQRSIADYIYTQSHNWYRLGLNVDNALAEGQHIWSTWATSYHGTSIDKAISIIEHRQLLIPGDIANDNHPISIVHGTKTAYYFTTPCIKYASLETYSRSILFNSIITGESYRVKVIVQLKQKPNSFRIHRGTIPYFYPPNPPICKIIKHEQLEWYSNARSSTVPYGLLIEFQPIRSSKNTGRQSISFRNLNASSKRSHTKSALATEVFYIRSPEVLEISHEEHNLYKPRSGTTYSKTSI